MKVLVISESHIGTHYTALKKLEKDNINVELLSLQGSNGIRFTNKGYSVSLPIKEYAGKFDLILLGTDLDLQGTKIASVLSYQLPKNSVRVAFTSDGYVRVGDIFSKKRLGKALALDRNHLQFANRIRKKFGFPNLGLGKALAIRRAVLLSNSQVKVKVLSEGTSTITVLTKAELKGMGAEIAYGRLESLYRSGVIEYPRVDNDYIKDFPYDLYPHPSLPRLDNDIFQPIQKTELPLSDKTILLELSNRRLITPANAIPTLKTIRMVLSSDLKPKEEAKEIVKYLLESLSDEDEENFKQTLYSIYRPPLRLSRKFKLTKRFLERLKEEGSNFAFEPLRDYSISLKEERERLFRRYRRR
jgi:hypothetical protein